METLPKEIVLIIFDYVSASYNYNLYRTSKKFRSYLSLIFKHQYNPKDLLACLLYSQNPIEWFGCYTLRNAIFLGTIEVLLKLDMDMEYTCDTILNIINY